MTNADCAACHGDVAKEHDQSFHRVAFTDGTYQASLALEEPKVHAFCNGCHAPDGPNDGVGCIACHGATPKAVRANRPGAKPAPHALTVDATFGTEAACASCHQFEFDDGRSDLVQRTLEEHAQSELAGSPCQQCHMAERGARRKHVFDSGHSLAWLKGSQKVDAKRRGPNDVALSIASYAGHAFPTGDMFRRVRLLVFGEREDGAIVASAERTFGRTWGADALGRRKELTDTRIRGTFRETFHLDADAPIARVRYVLLFERVLAQRADDVVLVSSDTIAEGLAQ